MAAGFHHRQSSRGAWHHSGAGWRQLLAEAVRLRRSGLPRRRRVHGSGQLGHGPGRRIALRLHAAQRDHGLEPDGDPAAGAGAAARHRQRPGSRAGLPGPLLPPHHDRAVAALRAGHRGLRSRRSDRLGDRPAAAVRAAADVGCLCDRARRAGGPVPATIPVPLRRGPGGPADPGDRRVVRGRIGPRPAGSRRRAARPDPVAGDRRPTPTCSTSRSGSSARR